MLQMIWIASLLSQLFLGFELSFFAFSKKFNIFTLFSIGIPIGFSLSALTFYLSSFFLRFNSLNLIIHSGAIFVTGYAFEFVRWRKKSKLIQKSLDKTSIFFFIFSIAFSLLIVPNMYFLKSQESNKEQNLKNYYVYAHGAFSGDIVEEISLMNSFYHGANSGFMNIFKIRHPTCYKCHARSRWLTALHSAMFLVGYSSYKIALVVPSFFMFYSICYLMLTLSFSLLQKSVFLSVLSTILFFFAGGFGFTYWLESGSRRNMNLDFVFDFGPKQTQWSHPLFHYIFALRPSQLSLSIFLSILLIITEINSLGIIEMAALGILVGVLPAIQHQTFICSIIFLLFYFLLTKPNLDQKRYGVHISRYLIRQYGVFFISFCIVSFFPLIHYMPRQNRSKMIVKEDFWIDLTNSGKFFAPIQVWFMSLGFFPLFTIIISWFFIYRNKKLLNVYIPSTAIFLFANFYRFQPYVRQNIIVFYPFWMSIACIVFIYTLSRISKMPRSEEAQGVLIGLFGFLFLCNITSSALGYYRLRTKSTIAWNKDMMEVANWIADNTPKKTVFISGSADFDLIPVLAGKVAILQNAKLAWINGFLPVQKESDIEKLLKSPSLPILPKVKYILNNEDSIDSRYFANAQTSNWTKVYSKGPYTLYQRN